MDLTRSGVDLGGLTDDEISTRVLDLHSEIARLEGELIATIDVFDRRKIHLSDGARSAVAWLTSKVDRTRARNAADVQLSHDLRDLPVAAAAAFRAGRLGRAKVDLLVSARTPDVADVFASQEEWLVAEVEGLRVADAAKFLRAWHQQARIYVGSIDPDEPVVETAPRVAVDLSPTFDGRYVLDGEMDAEHGHIVRSAIDAEVDHLFRTGTFSTDDGLSPAERRGHALVQIVTRKVRPGSKHDAPRPSVEVICDEKTLQGHPITDEDDLRTRICQYTDGTPLAPATLARFLCGADVHRLVISADGEVLDAGKTIRLANRAQRRALRFRHARHCAFPGCEAPTDWCEAHRPTRLPRGVGFADAVLIPEWDPDPTSDRGRTDLSNLVPLCRYHHHRVHEGGFTLVLKPDGTVEATRPDGSPPTPARRWRHPATRPSTRTPATPQQLRTGLSAERRRPPVRCPVRTDQGNPRTPTAPEAAPVG